MSEFTNLIPGDLLPNSVRVWNPILESARAYKSQSPVLSGTGQNVDNVPTNIILVHNTTSLNRVRGTTMKVLRAYAHSTGSFDSRFARQRVYPAVQSDERSTSIVRLIDSIPAGQVGRAQIVSPFADVDTGTLGHVSRVFGGHRVLGLPFFRCAELDWVRFNLSTPLTEWNVNGGFGFTGIVANSFNVANNAMFFPNLPYLKFNTAGGSPAHVYQGVQSHHNVSCFASIHSTFAITITRRTITYSGTTIGWAYDGCDCSMDGSPTIRESGVTIPPIYSPRLITGVTHDINWEIPGLTPPPEIHYSNDEPPATMTHVVCLVDPFKRYLLGAGGLIQGNWQFNRLPAYFSGGFPVADPQPIKIRCMSCLTSIIVWDVDDNVDQGGVINPPTTLGESAPTASIIGSGPDARLELSTGTVGGGSGVAVLPPSDTILARVSQASAGEAAFATGPNATHNLTMGGV